MSVMKSLSGIYRQATDFKNRLFDQEYIKIHRVDVPVVSIGNLTVGGTGKTPFVDLCVKDFLNRGLKVGVVSRAYKAEAKKPVRVNAQAQNAGMRFGDEPTWIAQQNPKASVFVGSQKWQIAEWAVSQEKLDVILVDDGFQHRRLHRDLDILILDATEKWERYQVLPHGRAREKFDSINRASVVVLSKCNWADPLDLKFLREQIPSHLPTIELHSEIRAFHSFAGDEVRGPLDLGTSVFLFSSIARPDLFEHQMRSLFKKVEAIEFADHHQYTAGDIEKILKARPAGSVLVCTEKDAVKLKPIWPEGEKLWISRLETEFFSGKEKLDACFDRLFS